MLSFLILIFFKCYYLSHFLNNVFQLSMHVSPSPLLVKDLQLTTTTSTCPTLLLSGTIMNEVLHNSYHTVRLQKIQNITMISVIGFIAQRLESWAEKGIFINFCYHLQGVFGSTFSEFRGIRNLIRS